MKDRGAKALAERLHDSYLRDPAMPRITYASLNDAERGMWKRHAGAILGTTGLFIVDVTKHEPILVNIPYPTDDPWIGCSCGWNNEGVLTESYFDHIT